MNRTYISRTTKRLALHAVFLLLGVFLFAGVADAQGLVPEGCKNDPTECGFNEFMQLINTIIGYVIRIAIPVAAALFAYAGFLFIVHSSNPGERSKAKKIFGSVFVGLVISLSAWLIVSFITTLLFKEQSAADPFKSGMIEETYDYFS